MNVYLRLDGKLAMFDVDATTPELARAFVRVELASDPELMDPVLAVIDGGKCKVGRKEIQTQGAQ